MAEIKQRNPTLKEKEKVAKMVALGALKFSMLNMDNVKPIKFDWDEALDIVAEKLEGIKSQSGPDAIGVLTSAKCTNEENYLLQKFARTVFGTNNVDHCARL